MKWTKDEKPANTFNLAAEELQAKAHAGRSGPLWVNSDETGQQGLHYPQLGRVIVAISFKYLETDEKETFISRKRIFNGVHADAPGQTSS